MPIYLLNDELLFPAVENAEEGIVAIGGDLSPERLLLAYKNGIFPWFNDDDPIIWWSPDPRFILELDDLHISKSMRRVLNSNQFTITVDTAFRDIVCFCADIERPDQDGTWITNDMMNAYCKLHELGYAHSVEVWLNNELVGGIYGVSLGKTFFGESMFHTKPNASKFAFIKLVELLKKNNFHFLDAQIHTEHVESLGGKNISRKKFITKLNEALTHDSWIGKWEI